MAVADNANPQDRQWEQSHVDEAKASLPWHNPIFWGGVMSSVWFAGMVLWAIYYAFMSAAKSDWIEKPAKAHEVQYEMQEMHNSMARIEQRVERVEGNAVRTDAKLDRITDLLIRGATAGRVEKEAAK